MVANVRSLIHRVAEKRNQEKVANQGFTIQLTPSDIKKCLVNFESMKINPNDIGVHIALLRRIMIRFKIFSTDEAAEAFSRSLSIDGVSNVITFNDLMTACQCEDKLKRSKVVMFMQKLACDIRHGDSLMKAPRIAQRQSAPASPLFISTIEGNQARLSLVLRQKKQSCMNNDEVSISFTNMSLRRTLPSVVKKDSERHT